MPVPTLDLQHPARAARIFMAILMGVVFGLLFANLGRVVHAAITAPTHVANASHVVVLGKRLSSGMVDEDFRIRLDRAVVLASANSTRELLISGGGPGTTEAAAGLHELQFNIVHALDPARIRLEEASSSTRENLDNIRKMLPENARPAVVSSRYHMARVSRLAAQSSMPVDLVAAEDRFSLCLASTGHMIKEAVYLTVLDLANIV